MMDRWEYITTSKEEASAERNELKEEKNVKMFKVFMDMQ